MSYGNRVWWPLHKLVGSCALLVTHIVIVGDSLEGFCPSLEVSLPLRGVLRPCTRYLAWGFETFRVSSVPRNPRNREQGTLGVGPSAGDSSSYSCESAYVLVLLKAWRPSFELVCSVAAVLGAVAVAAFWAAGCAAASPLYK